MGLSTDLTPKSIESETIETEFKGRVNGVIVAYENGVEYVTAVRIKIGESYTNTFRIERVERRYLNTGDNVFVKAEVTKNSPEIVLEVESIRNPEKSFLEIAILIEAEKNLRLNNG